MAPADARRLQSGAMSLRHLLLPATLLAVAAFAQNAPSTAPAAAPSPTTVWVSPRQTLALLNQPASGAASGLTVASGDPLTVLAQQGDYVQVRTEAGASGWIRRGNLSDAAPEPPADLKAANALLEEQVRTLDAQVRAFQDESAQLRNRMQALETELAARTRPVPLTAAGLWGVVQRLAADPRAWGALAALVLALLIAFRFGVEHRNRAIRERLGGLDL
jgi:Bacterial SH3 domain